MEPKLDLDSITIEDLEADNPGAISGTYGYEPGYGPTPEYKDTITLSSPIWSNTTVTGGGYNINNTSISASSYPYTVTGGNTAPYTISTGTGYSQPWASTSSTIKGAVLELEGDGADIDINGKSLLDMIGKIEERLNILHPNEKLEAEWEELRELGNRYRELEQHIKDKQATWDKLKAMPPPIVE